MRRREFITLLGGAAAGWPLTARAQQPATPVVGFLGSATHVEWLDLVAAFNKGLNERGYVDGQNVAVEYRWAEGRYDRMPDLAADLVRRRVDVIAATGGTRSVQAAMAATKTIPIVFVTGGDPVQLGLVSSINRPGGNVTGIMLFISDLAAKRLELLRDLVPAANVVAALVNPNNPITPPDIRDMTEAASLLGLQIHFLTASTESDINAAFAALPARGVGGLVVHVDPFLLDQRDRIVSLAARQRLPTVYGLREFAASGGLVSYGASIASVFREVGLYTGRILSGTKPADLPVLQPSRFEFVLNLKTAKALGLDIPRSVRAFATEVIE
jgi:putative tryptophan/tyrosine transport system substrate-binding protein